MVAVLFDGTAACIGGAMVVPCSGVEQHPGEVHILGVTTDGSPIVVRGGYVETRLDGTPVHPAETGIEVLPPE